MCGLREWCTVCPTSYKGNVRQTIQKGKVLCDMREMPYLMELTSQPLPTAALQMAEPASSHISFAHIAKMFIRTKETIPSDYEQAGDRHASRVLRVSRDVVFIEALKWNEATSPDGWQPGGGTSSLSGAYFNDLHVRPENDASEICMWFYGCSLMA